MDTTSGPTGDRPRPPVGWRIGRYRVEDVLGTGGFATVYRAVDERLDDMVAVKVLAENHSLDPAIRQRFLTEGRVLRRIDSPHVVAVHDLGETDRQQPYLVLEYAARGTLAERARHLRARGWRPTPADMWAVAEPLARALEAVHRAGVVHRDVNPGNVLLSTRGVTGRPGPATVVGADERVVLADLGLCKDLALHSGHTSAGGTEGFRPPELRGGPAIIDIRADLWSLSALLVWLATGAPPDGTPATTAIVRAGLPAALGRALERGLAEDPRHRQPDAPTWLAEIGPTLPRPSLAAPPAARFAPPPAPAPPAAPRTPIPPRTPGPAGPGWPGAQAAPSARGPQDMVHWPWAGGPGPQAVRAPQPHDRGWKLKQSAWVLTSLLFGLLTWAGFLYVGLQAKRAWWLWTAAAYGVGAGLFVVLAVTAPVDASGDIDTDTWQSHAGTATMLILWFGGIVHAVLANRRWLRWRATSV